MLRINVNRLVPAVWMVALAVVGMAGGQALVAAPTAHAAVVTKPAPPQPDPDADVSGSPYDSDSDNAVPPGSTGTGSNCENAGANCSGAEAGTNLDSNNDEV